MSISSPALSPSPAADHWDELVARQVKVQAGIEAAFDRADISERLGDFELAVDWLDRASALSGGLSPASRAQRAHCARELKRDER